MKIRHLVITGLLALSTYSCQPAIAQTTITTLGATDRVDRATLNANFNNLKQSVDAFHPSTTNHSSHNLDLWSNSVVVVSNIVGIGSGIITNFREMYVGTITVSKISVGTGSVSVADAAKWNSNSTWYVDSYDNLFYLDSNNVSTATNTYDEMTYMDGLTLNGTNVGTAISANASSIATLEGQTNSYVYKVGTLPASPGSLRRRPRRSLRLPVYQVRRLLLLLISVTCLSLRLCTPRNSELMKRRLPDYRVRKLKR